MYTNRIQKPKISSFLQLPPKRSLSYNDLKKKRLIRSEKSKAKLKPQLTEKNIRTQKKKQTDHFSIGLTTTPNTETDINKIQKSIYELKDVFDQIKQKVKTKKYTFSKPFYSDRIENKKISFIQKPTKNQKVSVFYESIQLAGDQKELIKQIISKKKSKRRLLKLQEIRAEIKRSKSKSKLQITQNDISIKVPTSSSKSNADFHKDKKNIHVNKFQTIKQKPFNSSIKQIQSNKSEIKKNQSIDNNFQKSQSLGLKRQYNSRRKLNIADFQTDRRLIDHKNNNSQSRLKFHRKLRKTNSEIVIKTKEVTYNKHKYMLKVQNKSTIINVSGKKQNKQQQNINKNFKKHEDFTEEQKQKPYATVNVMEGINQDNMIKELDLSAINVSQIELKKEQSLTDFQSELNIVQTIEAQQLQINMKKTNNNNHNNQDSRNEIKNLKSQKQTPKKIQAFCGQMQNAENIESLSNILDFVALPTKQLKIKISKCSSKVSKKKNQLEKFKKIFPINFFNK